MFQEVTCIYLTSLQPCPKSISYCKLLIIVELSVSFYEHPPDPKIGVLVITGNKQKVPLGMISEPVVVSVVIFVIAVQLWSFYWGIHSWQLGSQNRMYIIQLQLFNCPSAWQSLWTIRKQFKQTLYFGWSLPFDMTQQICWTLIGNRAWELQWHHYCWPCVILWKFKLAITVPKTV